MSLYSWFKIKSLSATSSKPVVFKTDNSVWPVAKVNINSGKYPSANSIPTASQLTNSAVNILEPSVVIGIIKPKSITQANSQD